MSKKSADLSPAAQVIHLGANPVNDYQARIYAQESSPSIVAVVLELTENARDNATDVTLSLEIEDCEQAGPVRSEEHTSELQSLRHLVCRLLLEKKQKDNVTNTSKSTLFMVICRFLFCAPP